MKLLLLSTVLAAHFLSMTREATSAEPHTPKLANSQRQIAGIVTLQFDPAAMDSLRIRFLPQLTLEEFVNDTFVTFAVEPHSTFRVERGPNGEPQLTECELQTCGALLIDRPGPRIVLGNLLVERDASGMLVIKSTLDERIEPMPVFVVMNSMLDSIPGDEKSALLGELVLTEAFAAALEEPTSAGMVVGAMVLELQSLEGTQKEPAASCASTASGEAGSPVIASVGPDVLVADLQAVIRYSSVNDVHAYAVATNACNIGTQRVSWISFNNRHPVIVQNLFRMKEDRFEQIGMAWVKHGFYAVSESVCSPCNDPTNGTQLGVGCSDPYSASLNGIQTNMSARSIVNAHTGVFPYYGATFPARNSIERRLQVRASDLDPSINTNARYFVEGHYITSDDCSAGNQDNNASYRELRLLNPAPDVYDLAIQPGKFTQRGQAAVRAWKDADTGVVETDIRVPGEGLFILAAKATSLGASAWRYSYALQNLNSDRSAQSFRISLPYGISVFNVGFHDVEYHSGDPYSSTDWDVTLSDDGITWATESFEANPNANALRYDTVYSFYFDAYSQPATDSMAVIRLFKPGQPTQVTGATIGPQIDFVDCNQNGVPDPCDVDCTASECMPPCGGSVDCDGNRVPDECELDCNDNGIADPCDLRDCPAGDLSCADCNNNRIPDGCETDCNGNQLPDDCDVANCPPGEPQCADCNGNLVPDACEADCDGDGIPDACDPPTDQDADGVTDCLDRCPTTTPVGACIPPESVICWFPAGFCLQGYPRDACLRHGGTPTCDPNGECTNTPCQQRQCREGCLVGDDDHDGDLDLYDYCGLQSCFTGSLQGGGTKEPTEECLHGFDFDSDGDVDAADFGLFLGGIIPD